MRNYAHLILVAVAGAAPVAVRAADETQAAAAAAQIPLTIDRFDIVRGTDPMPPASFSVPDVKISARGLTDPDPQPFAPDAEKAVGAKVRPFKDWNLLVGTEMTRGPDSDRALREEFNWQLSWSRRWDSLAGLNLEVSTNGAVAAEHAGMAQRAGLSETLGGSIGIPLFRDTASWDTQFRISPRVSLDLASGTWKSVVTPELVTEKALSSPAAPMKSVLSFKVGSGVASDARPSASAKVELKITAKE